MKLGLGTVQFGMNYGVSNLKGQPNLNEIGQILNLAKENGVELLDTAPAYGESEKTIGEITEKDDFFKIVTKTSPEFSFSESLKNLKKEKVYGLLIHDVKDFKIIPKLEKLKEEGLVEKIGVSVYNSVEINRVLESYSIDLIQIPLNLLDQRLIKSGHLKKLKQSGVEIHVRSAFLQGALLMAPQNLPESVKSISGHLKDISTKADKANLTMLELALGFAMNRAEVDKVLVGITSQRELREVIAAGLKASEYSKAIDEIAESSHWDDENILNPAKWKRAL